MSAPPIQYASTSPLLITPGLARPVHPPCPRRAHPPSPPLLVSSPLAQAARHRQRSPCLGTRGLFPKVRTLFVSPFSSTTPDLNPSTHSRRPENAVKVYRYSDDGRFFASVTNTTCVPLSLSDRVSLLNPLTPLVRAGPHAQRPGPRRRDRCRREGVRGQGHHRHCLLPDGRTAADVGASGCAAASLPLTSLSFPRSADSPS